MGLRGLGREAVGETQQPAKASIPPERPGSRAGHREPRPGGREERLREGQGGAHSASSPWGLTRRECAQRGPVAHLPWSSLSESALSESALSPSTCPSSQLITSPTTSRRVFILCPMILESSHASVCGEQMLSW